MNKISGDLVHKFMVVYFEDILIYSKNELDHVGNVQDVILRLLDNYLYVKESKFFFNAKEVTFLGYVLNPDGLTMDTEKLQNILDWPAPLTVKGLNCFLGFANFCFCFIKNCSMNISNLTSLTKKDGPFVLTDQFCMEFEALKTCCTTVPIL